MGIKKFYRSNWSHAKYFKPEKSHHTLLILLVFLSDSSVSVTGDELSAAALTAGEIPELHY